MIEPNFLSKQHDIIMLLSTYLKNGLCLALSGGVDSGLLAGIISGLIWKANIIQPCRFYAVTFNTPFYSQDEIIAAQELCKSLNLNHTVIDIDMRKMPKSLFKNPKDRCFICKKAMFKHIITFCKEKKLQTIIDGTNFDDLSVYRPGKKALEELGIKSPLAECGFTKIEIRKFAKKLNLHSIASKPSLPCFATRLPYGTFLDIDILQKIAACEHFLHSLQFIECRLRFHNPVMRIEIPEKKFSAFLKHKAQIISVLKDNGFKYITLDIEGLRSGSMD